MPDFKLYMAKNEQIKLFLSAAPLSKIQKRLQR